MFGAQICVYCIMRRHEFVIIIACKDGLVDKQIPTNLSVFFMKRFLSLLNMKTLTLNGRFKGG